MKKSSFVSKNRGPTCHVWLPVCGLEIAMLVCQETVTLRLGKVPKERGFLTDRCEWIGSHEASQFYKEGKIMNRALNFWDDRDLNPFREVPRAGENIDRFFDDVICPIATQYNPPHSTGRWNPDYEVEESETHYLLSFDLPGVAKEEMKIEVSDNQMIVSGVRREGRRSGEKRQVTEPHGWKFGKFERHFTLPTTVDIETVEAALQDGVLRIAIPKSELVKKRTIEIGPPPGRKKRETVEGQISLAHH